MNSTPVQEVVTVLDAFNNAGIYPLKLIDDPDWQSNISNTTNERGIEDGLIEGAL